MTNTIIINKHVNIHNRNKSILSYRIVSCRVTVVAYRIVSCHCRIASYRIVSCRVTVVSYLILSYLILSYLILSYLILSYLILSYLILSYLIYAANPFMYTSIKQQGQFILTLLNNNRISEYSLQRNDRHFNVYVASTYMQHQRICGAQKNAVTVFHTYCYQTST